MMGLEPTTFCMASRRSSQLSYIRVEGPSIASGGGPKSPCDRPPATSGGPARPLTLRPLGDVAEWLTRGPAKPFTPVRFRSSPLGVLGKPAPEQDALERERVGPLLRQLGDQECSVARHELVV